MATDFRRTLLHTVILLSSGCTGDLVQFGASPLGDGAVNTVPVATGDMAGTPTPPTTTPKFYPDVQTDLDSLGCTSSFCHGNAGPGIVMVLLPAPTAAADTMANYDNFKQRAMAGAQSLALTKPLGVAHTGGQQLTSTSDPIYVKWLAWINAGNPEQ